MTDRVVVRCPGCQQKLKIKTALLIGGVKCPTCGRTLRVKSSHPPGSTGVPGRAEQSGIQSNPGVGHKPSRKSSAADFAGGNPARQRGDSSAKRGSPSATPARDEDEYVNDPWEDDADEFNDHDDAYLEEDVYDETGDDGDSWLNDDLGGNDYGGAGNDWDAPTQLPSRPRRKPEGRARRKARPEPENVRVEGNVVAWVGGGLVAGLLAFAMTVALGYTGVPLVIGLSAFVSAGMIGGVIRALAGDTDGWGPGLVAVAIAVPAIFLGRVGAYYVDPDIAGIFGEDERTPEQVQEDIASQVSAEGMIAQIVEDDVYYDEQWQRGNGITDDNFYADTNWEDDDWDEDAWEATPLPERYHKTVWAEGQRRWNELSPDVQADRTEGRRLQLLLDEGMLDDASFAKLVERRTTDAAMTETISYEVHEDEAWLTTAGVTSDQLDDHYDQTYTATDPLERIHPTIREEAVRRWTEMPDEEKASRRSAIEQELREEIESFGEIQELTGHFRLGAAVVWALISLFMPFRPIVVTFASIFLAFKLGSGLASD